MWYLSPSDVNILIAGFHTVTGYPDGSFVSIKKDNVPFETARTMDGKIHRCYTLDKSFTVSLSLVQTSPTNDILMKLYQLDCLTNNASFPFFLKDQLGTTLFLSSESWIKNIPEITYSNGMEVRVWEIQCLEAILNIGSNDGSSSLLDVVNVVSDAIPSIRGLI